MNGIINVYKEQGFTSHDVVAKLRGILQMKKIGHTGTLDPDAVGVLPICVGKATKVVELLTNKDKTYIAKVKCGVQTDTLDMSGEILQTSEQRVTKEEVEQVIPEFTGQQQQIPPMYSAIKVNGKKLYELARKGETIQRKPRKITIHELSLLSFDEDNQEFEIQVCCSKGTYIRSLCDDIGKKLGCGAAMKELRRTQVGVFFAEDALTLDEIQRRKDDGTLEEIFVSIEEMFPDYPKVYVKEDGQKLLENGNDIPCRFCDADGVKDGAYVRMYKETEFYAIYQKEERKNKYKTIKMFH